MLTRGLGSLSIRHKLVLMVGVLLGLGALNVGVYYWGAQQRAREFARLRQAIERQTIIVEVMDRLQDQKKFVDLLGSGVLGLGEGASPGILEQEQFGRALDSISGRLGTMARISEAAERDSISALRQETEELARWWKAFYANQGVDATAAVVASVTAEPIAAELLTDRLPAAVGREKERLSEASEAFIETDETASRIAWILFLVSALVGGGLSFYILRDLFRSIEALKSGAQQIGSGRLDHRIELQADDELGEVAGSFNRMAIELERHTEQIDRERKISEELLLNILPAQIASELREQGRVEPKYYADTTILFADLVRFTRLFDQQSVDRMVHLLDQLFTEFDRIARGYRLEKLKTIGDAYMCAGGLARDGASHPVDAVLAAFDIIDVVKRRGREVDLPLAIRVGIHTGPVAAGVVGIDKFAFDLWGETVNFAARLEATGAPDRINVSTGTHLRIKDFFACEKRGPIETKEQRSYDMYFVAGIHPELAGAGCPPPEFATRYRIYFERDAGAFPEALTTGSG